MSCFIKVDNVTAYLATLLTVWGISIKLAPLAVPPQRECLLIAGWSSNMCRVPMTYHAIGTKGALQHAWRPYWLSTVCIVRITQQRGRDIRSQKRRHKQPAFIKRQIYMLTCDTLIVLQHPDLWVNSVACETTSVDRLTLWHTA